MTSQGEHHGWWWTKEEDSRYAAYLQAQAAGARAAEGGYPSSACPYREIGGAEERRLLACWSWGWSRVSLFDEPAERVALGPPPVARGTGAELGTVQHEESTATPLARWGLPDKNGRFLVRVVDYQHYEFAEDLSGVGNWLLGAVREAVQQLHTEANYLTLDRYYELVAGEHANPLVAQLPDGTLLAAVGHEGYSMSPRRESRPPSRPDLARWAGLPPPPPPPPPPPTPLEWLLARLQGLQGIDFHTKRGVPFRLRLWAHGLLIKRPQRRDVGISRWELSRALDEWPASGPAALEDAFSTRAAMYLWAILADERVLGSSRTAVHLVEDRVPPGK